MSDFGAQRAQIGLDTVKAGQTLNARAIGNFSDASPIASVANWVYPFAEFHINAQRVSLANMARNPIYAYAMGKYLADNEDEFGRVPVLGGYMGDLSRLYTGLHTVDFFMHWGEYAKAAISDPTGSNNAAQIAGRVAARGIVGNNAVVQPFPWVNYPGLAAENAVTHPVRDAKGKVVRDDQLKAYSLDNGPTGLLRYGADKFAKNEEMRQELRAAAPYIGNTAGMALGYAGRPIAAAVGLDVQPASDPYKALPYRAPELGAQMGWSRERTQAAMTRPDSDDGKALRRAFEEQYDLATAGKLSPVPLTKPDDPGVKPIYPDTSSRPFFYERGLGQGGTDAGMRVPNGRGGYSFDTPAEASYHTAQAIVHDRAIPDGSHLKQEAAQYLLDVGRWEFNPDAPESEQRAIRADRALQGARDVLTAPSDFLENRGRGEGGIPYNMDARQYETARDQLGLPQITPESVRTMDYARDFLRGVGAPDVRNGVNISEQRTTQAQADLRAREVANDVKTGRYLSPEDRSKLIDYDAAKEAYEGRRTSGGITVRDLLSQPGNYYDTLDKAGKATGDEQRRLYAAADRMKNQTPETADYFAAIEAAGKRDEISRLNLRRDDALLNPDTQAALAPLGRAYEFIGANGERIKAGGNIPTARDQSAPNVRADRQYWDTFTPEQRQAVDAYRALEASDTGQRYFSLQEQAPKKGEPGYSEWWNRNGDAYRLARDAYNRGIQQIQDATGVNPKAANNALRAARGLPPTAEEIAPPSASTSSSRATGVGYSGPPRTSGSVSNTRGGASTYTETKQAGDAFYAAYRDLTPTEKRIVRTDDAIARVLTSGEQHTAKDYQRALERLQARIEDVKKSRTMPADYRRAEGTWTSSGAGLRPTYESGQFVFDDTRKNTAAHGDALPVGRAGAPSPVPYSGMAASSPHSKTKKASRK